MQDLFNLFEQMRYPYHRQGSLSDDNYPNSFFTFWNYSTPGLSFYDNEEKRYVERIQVCFYTNDAKLIYTVIDQFITEAKKVGFVIANRPYDVPADKDNYYGRLVNIDIIHKED